MKPRPPKEPSDWYDVPLTRGAVAKVCVCHYHLVSEYKWYCSKRGYAERSPWADGKKQPIVKMHRLINNTPRGVLTDHINGDKLDNRCSNLRDATIFENTRNASAKSTNKTGCKGVSYDRQNKKFRAGITVNRKAINLGRYSTLEEAALAYQIAAIELHGDFAHV